MKWVTRDRPKVDRIACPWQGGQHLVLGEDLHHWLAPVL
ncbi:TPA: chromate resistance protein [Pseudomonas aeruginosa]|nr:chromate resistance protein [Pseudomonas aeruginosa]HCJ0901010.1 chromate resistance protein [Pseudomonas aeruginosa]HCJ1437325.1 chromate resistance protein [Pseudomonas aeruginosa]HCJ1449503.1 chromate resistance protein [Pseudomonas aeruginosa]HCJ4896450.1 chromate resistance protein [Pseudomonas aeruginosa]